ncbi:MAG: hypothetical protein ACHQ4F_08625 [Candidatus Dormibacteria bacterium]
MSPNVLDRSKDDGGDDQHGDATSDCGSLSQPPPLRTVLSSHGYSTLLPHIPLRQQNLPVTGSFSD